MAVVALALGVVLGVLVAWATGAGPGPVRSGVGPGDAGPAGVGQELIGDGADRPLPSSP